MLARLRQSEFIVNVSKVFAGNGIVFAISLFAIPVVSRLYTPEHYGVIGLFISISSVVAIIATLKYEMALVLPEKDETAGDLLRATFLVTVLISLLTLVAIAVMKLCCSRFQIVESLGRYIWLLPVIIFLTATSKLLVNGWLIRKKQFGRMALAGMSNTLVNLGLRISLGFFIGSTVWGLVAGLLLGFAAGLLVAWPQSREGFKCSEGTSALSALKNYPEFPIYTMPADFVRTFAQNLPIFMLGFIFSPVVSGLYYMADRLIKAPVELGLHAFRGVYLQKMSAMYNAHEPLRATYVKTVAIMFLLGVGPALLLFTFGTEILTFVLGDKWMQAGEFAEILAPLLLSFWITSPAAMLLITLRRQNYWLIVQATIAVLQLIVFLYTYTTGQTAVWALSAFVTVQLVINLLLMMLVFGLLGRQDLKSHPQ
ncbi:MAG: oligosaccharide flippase family protein [Gammaproteobacteria bacterium]